MSAPEFEILDGDIEALRVFEHFMDTGRPADADIIGCPPGPPIGCTECSDLDGLLAWAPSVATMRAVILALRERIGTLDREAHPERYRLEGRDYAESNCP